MANITHYKITRMGWESHRDYVPFHMQPTWSISTLRRGNFLLISLLIFSSTSTRANGTRTTDSNTFFVPTPTAAQNPRNPCDFCPTLSHSRLAVIQMLPLGFALTAYRS